MSKLAYRTIADERPQGKPNVYFSCHPDDFDTYFEEYAAKILRIQDCAIWYESEPEADYDKEDLELNLSQMQLFVMPVTTKLLTDPCRAMEVELPLAREKHIPVLPLMMEQGLDDMFSKHFGDLQYLDPNNTDETKRKFDEVLETYIKSVLVSDELAEKVRAAFDAYIFLSYRKKDRRKAQELMRLIHRNQLCRDIAIWYDEFLTPGEDFNQLIGKMLEKSDLFAIVVTPNLVNETNYVMTTEYPAAMEQKKPVLPVEMEETDRGKLDKHYKALPPCVKGEESETFRAALLEKIRTMAVEANDTDPGHNFLIGLAYLDGIDVEVDNERAVELITGAAEAGIPEAIQQLVTMYETGKGVKRDYYEGVRWREKHVEYLRKVYKSKSTENNVYELVRGLWNLGDAQQTLRMLDAAQKAYGEMCLLTEQYSKSGKHRYFRYLAISYERLGVISELKGNLEGAQAYIEKSLGIFEKLSEKMGTVESRRFLPICYDILGEIARAKGDYARAQAYYKKSWVIREELAKETGKIEARMDLFISYNRLGDMARSMGDLEGAQDYYKKELAIAEELSKETGMVEARRNLAISYDRLGEMARAKGDFEEAQAYYEKSLAIREEIAKETGTIESKRDLSNSYIRLGDMARTKGELDREQAYYEKGLTITEKLSEKTGTIESRRDLFISYNRLGDITSAKGDLEGAQAYYERELAIAEELSEMTGTVEARRDLAIVYDRLGGTARARGDLEGAQAYYEKELAIAEELSEMTGTVEAKRNLFISFNRLGDMARAKGRLAVARAYYEKELAIAEELSEKTGMYEAMRDLSISYDRLGDTVRDEGNLTVAQIYFERCLAIREELIGMTGTAESERDLSISYIKLGDIVAEIGIFMSAQTYYEACLAIREKLAEKIVTTQTQKDLAQILFKMGVFYYNKKISKSKAKMMLERVVELGKGTNDEVLTEQCGEAEHLLDLISGKSQ